MIANGEENESYNDVHPQNLKRQSIIVYFSTNHIQKNPQLFYNGILLSEVIKCLGLDTKVVMIFKKMVEEQSSNLTFYLINYLLRQFSRYNLR